MLLFLSTEDDTHVDWIEAECERRQAPYQRFCTEAFPQAVALTLAVEDGQLGGALHFPDRAVALDQIRGVWYRRPGLPNPAPGLSQAVHDFALREAHATLRDLYRSLGDRRWVNPPHLDLAANHKVHQLHLAQRLGFQIPRTLVTNDPAEALAFFHECGQQMIYKFMRPLFATDAEGLALGMYTTMLTAADMEAHWDAIRMAPCLFQAYIPKQYELRINVIGNYVWAAGIFSQSSPETQIDYRRNTTASTHAPVLIPPALEELCLRLARHLGLRMCNIDMILTPTGEYVFLEVNPNGQWAWVEDLVGFPLAAALVDELLGVNTLAHHPYLKDRSLHFVADTAIKQR